MSAAFERGVKRLREQVLKNMPQDKNPSEYEALENLTVAELKELAEARGLG